MKKNILLINKKVKKKNQIFEYYTSGPKRLIKMIYKKLINEKLFNLIEN